MRAQELSDARADPARAAALAAGWAEAWAQPKLDGVRGLATAAGLRTRGGRRVARLPAVAAAAARALRRLPAGWALDGELYAPGAALQDIAGAVARRAALPGAPPVARRLRLYVFDLAPPPGARDPGWLARWRMAARALRGLSAGLRLVPAWRVGPRPSAAACAAAMRRGRRWPSEGVVLRARDGPYVLSGRTPWAAKLKPRRTREYRCVGWRGGAGRDAAAVVWQLEARPGGPRFWARPAWPYAERRAAFRALRAGRGARWLGRPATVAFAGESRRGLPLQPRVLAFRTYE